MSTPEKNSHTPPESTDEKIQKKEDALDEALEEGFPASDPVAISITPKIKKPATN
ncbi:hypothetical protein [Undibacterium sp. TJN19]|uniref:hypothetical protein n=1 Tax=Undibacterium sp. TJN19 TaxID=3413055 RepID=UPI003BEF6906